MFQKIIPGFTFVALSFIGVILAQTNDNIYQSNSNSANISSNLNRGRPLAVLSPAKKDREKIESCRLISRSDAERLLGKGLESARDTDKDGETSCTYATPGKDAKVLGYSLRIYPTRQAAKKAFRLNREIDGLSEVVYPGKYPHKIQTVTGIGEVAWSLKDRDSLDLFVLKKKTTFDILISRNDQPSFQELKRIAQKIASHF